ncbi:MAG: HAD hydrolase-like protein [Verrucomicrobiae bacterium]|nr:HAD hydrolase-like protein [Verrucomicrobiae bacterium]NNJ42058.1 HAD hydrolase-like protein [Akkermansiaceae bacterium]
MGKTQSFKEYVLISLQITPTIARVIRSVIFDLDGTLIHSLPGLAASLNRVLKMTQLPTHPEQVVRTFIGNGIHKLVERAVPAGYATEDIPELVSAMSADYAATWKEGTTRYPGTAETLSILADQQIRTAVFSNKPDVFCRQITDHLFPDTSFSIVLGQRQGTPTKPDPEGAHVTARALGDKPQEIAFVGDSTIDLSTARNAAMIPVAATWGYHDLAALESENPRHIIHRIEDLIPIINTSL